MDRVGDPRHGRRRAKRPRGGRRTDRAGRSRPSTVRASSSASSLQGHALVTASALAAATGCDDDGQYINRTWKLFYRSCPTDDTASGAPSRYHARVQEIELILVAAGLIVSAAYIVAQSRSRGTTDHFAVRLLLGLIPAVVAV